MGRRAQIKNGLFITGTDTDVGKTVATYVIGALLKNQGVDVGIMKPVQCGGHDAAFLKEHLELEDTLEEINPYYAPDSLSPHLAFRRCQRSIRMPKIQKAYQRLAARHQTVLIEGAGGLMVPLRKDWFVVDLARELGLDVLIVARLGLGTINHTLLTIEQVRQNGLNVAGVLFSQMDQGRAGPAEADNPDIIQKAGQVPVWGTVPFLKDFKRSTILRQCGRSVSVRYFKAPSKKTVTKKISEDDKRFLWHPFTQMQDWLQEDPLVIDRAQGVYLTDIDGRRYIDGVSSLWVNVHGHGHKAINTAVQRQVSRLDHSTLLGLTNTPAIQLAEKLVQITPKGLDKVFYSDNGSTSVEIAIKMAYQYWQNIGQTKKCTIAHLTNAYHGDTLGSVSVGGIDLFHKVYRRLIFKTLSVNFPEGYRVPDGQSFEAAALDAVDAFERLLEKKASQIAALVVEPIVQGAAGILVWPKGILKAFERVCRKHDVLLIADEVATGFGRTGTMFACAQENVRPDFLCLAKGITGGYLPLAATLTSRNIFDGFCFDYKDQKTFFHGHTYTGNPICCAAALASLEVFERDKVIERLQPKIKHLSHRLRLFYNLQAVGDIRQKGFMVGIELVQDQTTKKPYPWEEKMGARVCLQARRYGVILRPLGNVVVIMPPLSISKSELDELLDAAYQAIQDVTEEDSEKSVEVNDDSTY